MGQGFTQKVDFTGLDITQISMIRAVLPQKRVEAGEEPPQELVVYGLGRMRGVRMPGSVAQAQALLKSQGVDLHPLPGLVHGGAGFIKPDFVNYLHQAKENEDGTCGVMLGISKVPYPIQMRLAPDALDGLKGMLDRTGKTFFVKQVRHFHEPPALKLPVLIDGKMVIVEGQEKRPPSEYPPRLVMIDPQQIGLIRTNQRCLSIAFNECAGLSFERGYTQPVPNLRESFAAMNPALDGEAVLRMVDDYYKKKSLESLESMGEELARQVPGLIRIPDTLHLACVKKAAIARATRDKDHAVWLDFHEAFQNYAQVDPGLSLDFRNDADRDAALRLLSLKLER